MEVAARFARVMGWRGWRRQLQDGSGSSGRWWNGGIGRDWFWLAGVKSRRGWIPRGIWWSGGGDGTNPLEIRVGLIWQELDYIYGNRIVDGPSDLNRMIVNNIARESK